MSYKVKLSESGYPGFKDLQDLIKLSFQ
jgi:hypothetical protein